MTLLNAYYVNTKQLEFPLLSDFFLNLFHVTGLFLYPVKTSKNVWFSQSSRSQIFIKIGVLRLQLYQKEAPTQVFSSEVWEIFQKAIFIEHFRCMTLNKDTVMTLLKV